jgi:rhamnogalacturonyl hydrolase YesR
MNMVNGKHKILRQEFSEDTHGRTLWALGYLLSQKEISEKLQKKVERMFRKGTPPVRNFTSPRAIAFATLGLSLYALSKPTAPTTRYRALIEKLADKQMHSFKETAGKDWLWFEEELTYSNSKLPESLFYAYLVTKKKSYLEIAEKSLNFLLKTTFEKGYFSAIGQNGWYLHHGKRAYFDQQPEDASSMVQTLTVAWHATKKSRYRKLAFDTFQWFLGKNHLNQMVYDESTGGCYDGLGQHTLNLNQGAESTLSYLLARLAVEEL